MERTSSALFISPRWCWPTRSVLNSLSERDFRAGYAEVVKYGLIGDRGFFEFLEANWRDVFAGGPARAEAIAVSCAAKARVVAADETEQGERALLNLGHTFGHALENLTRYDSARLVHGEGVAIGMASRFPLLARPRLVLGAGRDAGRGASEGGRPSDPDARHSRLRRERRTISWPRCARTRRSSAAG